MIKIRISDKRENSTIWTKKVTKLMKNLQRYDEPDKIAVDTRI